MLMNSLSRKGADFRFISKRKIKVSCIHTHYDYALHIPQSSHESVHIRYSSQHQKSGLSVLSLTCAQYSLPGCGSINSYIRFFI